VTRTPSVPDPTLSAFGLRLVPGKSFRVTFLIFFIFMASDWESAPFPATVKNLGEKKECKIIRKTVFYSDMYRHSFCDRLEDGVGKRWKVVIPENEIFGAPPNVREACINYWKSNEDSPNSALCVVVGALTNIAQDKDGKEALDELDTIIFKLEIQKDKLEPSLSFPVTKEGKSLVITMKHAYNGGWEKDPGDGSASTYQKEIEAIL